MYYINLNLLDFITLRIFGECTNYKAPHYTVLFSLLSSLLSQNILLTTFRVLRHSKSVLFPRCERQKSYCDYKALYKT
jgi:hypothetical protein